jgi:branched-chain amino acid transport system ATP-binding protein
MTDPAVILDVIDVEKSFGQSPAVQGVSFTVKTGETLALIGPNGAGKSTMFGLAAGEHRPDRGTVRYRGRNATRWSAARRCRAGLSRTFQVASFFGTRTVRENLILSVAAASGHPFAFWDRFVSGAAKLARVESMLTELSLASQADLRADTLAQGDRKRLEFAMALVQQPRLLLLDEPTAGMSLEDIRQTIDLLKTIKTTNPDLAIVLTAHDMDVVFSVSDRVLLMGQGKLILEGTPAEVEAAAVTRELYLGVQVP